MAESKKGHNFAILGTTKQKIRLFFVLMLHIKFQGFTQIGFQDTVGTKREITLAIFDALPLKVNQQSSYSKDTVYQISTPYLKRLLSYRVRKKA